MIPPATRGQRALGGALILATAVGLRFYDLDWGLPEGIATVDERVVWPPRLSAFIKHGFTQESLIPSKLVYPPAVAYLMGLIAYLATKLGILQSLPVAPEMAGIFLGRIVTATLDVATVPLTGLLASRLYSPREGWTAAALMAVTPLAIGQAHYLSVDPISGTVVPIVGLAALRLHRSPDLKSAVLAGMACGLAFGVKYNGVALGILPAVSLVAILFRDGFRPAVTLALTIFLAFLATASVLCISCLFYWDKFIQFMEQYLWYLSLGGVTAPYGMSGRPFFLLFTLPGALGWPAYAAAWLGLGTAIRHRRLEDVLVVVGLVTLVVPLMTSQFFLRYLLPTLPLFAILGARGLGALTATRHVRSVATTVAVASSLFLSLLWVPAFSTDVILRYVDELPKRPPRIGVLAINPTGSHFGFEWNALKAARVPKVAVSIIGNPDPTGKRRAWIHLADSCRWPIETLIVPDRIYKFWAKNHGVLGEPYDESSLFKDAPCWVKQERVCRTCTLDQWSPWWWPGRGDYSFGASDFDVYTK